MEVGALGGDEVTERVIKIESHVLAYIGQVRGRLEPARTVTMGECIRSAWH